MEINRNSNSNDVSNVNGDINISSWGFDTNWTVAQGSLQTSVTVESSDSVIYDEDNDIEAVDSTVRSQPLILKPPSPDSGPCEIKISFTQKYEIRQVYVRSTARVYEIYYAPSPLATNDYLCTVRCSTAERDGETLQVTNVENVKQDSRGSTGDRTEAKYTGEANSSSSEDDWVEVKVPESPLYENGIISLPNKTKINFGSSIQDLYEATAEISDADSCTSVTIRLLSLQNKCCVYVDEVYVFADPVDSGDLENQPVQIGSSSGSALMAMLVPTLLQFKSRAGQSHEKIASDKLEKDAEVECKSVDQIHEKIAPDKLKKDAEVESKSVDQIHEKIAPNKLKKVAEVESKSVDSTNVAHSTHQDEKFCVDQQNGNFHDTRAEPANFQLPRHDPVGSKHDISSAKNDVPLTRIEGLLEQLVSRVSRIEDFCSRFEEKMLKPIDSMEARLQRVEQQLEVLSKNSHYSGLSACKRTCAPSFLCGEINSSSTYDDSSRQPLPRRISESENRDLTSTDMSQLSNGFPISESIPHFLPSLVISAPEFSCGDDDEDNDDLKSSEGTYVEKPKRPLSIDDALAAALSGFLSTSSNSSSEGRGTLEVSVSGVASEVTDNNEPSAQTIGETDHEFTIKENDNLEPSKFTEVLTVTAPEFTLEGGGDEENSDYVQSSSVTASRSMSKEDGNEDSIVSQRDEAGNFKISSNACAISGKESTPIDNYSGCAKQNMMATSVPDVEQCQSSEKETNHIFEDDGDACLDSVARSFGDTDYCQINEEFGPMERGNDMPSVQNDGIKMWSRDQPEDRYDTSESAAESTECVARDVSDRSALLNLTESLSTSAVDLEFPILDVKFASHESSMIESPFEALLRDVAGINSQTPVQEADDEVIIGEQADGTLTGDDKAVDRLSSDILLLDLGISDEDVSSSLGSGVHDASPSSSHPILASLI